MFVQSSRIMKSGILIGAIAMVVALYGAFLYAPQERIMGDVQRIFYFHVPIAINAFLAFFVTFVASIIYLIRKDLTYDLVASSAVEIGVMFTSLVLITGSLWARPV